MTETMIAARSEYACYSLLKGTLIMLSVGVLEQLPKRNRHAMKKSMLL